MPDYGMQNYGFLDNQQPTIGGKQVDLYKGTNLASLSQEPSETIGTTYHSPYGRSVRKYLGSAGALREALGYAYGIDPGGRIGKKRGELLGKPRDIEPLDPVVRLEESLLDEYRNYKLGIDEEKNKQMLQQMFENRGNVLRSLTQQRGAAMGTPGLYQRALSANESIRDTLVSQSLAAYKPMQAIMEQEYEDQNNEILRTIQQIQSETEASIRSIGQGASFK